MTQSVKTSWRGPAAWGAKEAKAGDRLPYARHLTDHHLALRDGSVMCMLQVPGLPFETEDADALNHHLGVREVMLRSVLDARFIVYHHVVRRRVSVRLDESIEAPFAALLNRRWQGRLDERRLFVNEQLITIVRRAARGKTGWPERIRRKLSRQGGEVGQGDLRALDA
ncbi:MAG: VirB4 family type IV secretion/conjugal transfer ATPase, partial [Sphingomonadales bacterium]|nr:VirB4 family type IV secretion/conjugal transfer ATPase [Sphingomonadales bacterium]